MYIINMYVVQTFWKNGNIFQKYVTINGLIEGECKSYHTDCQMWIICNYKNELIEGEYKEYSRIGQLKKNI